MVWGARGAPWAGGRLACQELPPLAGGAALGPKPPGANPPGEPGETDGGGSQGSTGWAASMQGDTHGLVPGWGRVNVAPSWAVAGTTEGLGDSGDGQGVTVGTASHMLSEAGLALSPFILTQTHRKLQNQSPEPRLSPHTANRHRIGQWTRVCGLPRTHPHICTRSQRGVDQLKPTGPGRTDHAAALGSSGKWPASLVLRHVCSCTFTALAPWGSPRSVSSLSGTVDDAVLVQVPVRTATQQPHRGLSVAQEFDSWRQDSPRVPGRFPEIQGTRPGDQQVPLGGQRYLLLCVWLPLPLPPVWAGAQGRLGGRAACTALGCGLADASCRPVQRPPPLLRTCPVCLSVAGTELCQMPFLLGPVSAVRSADCSWDTAPPHVLCTPHCPGAQPLWIEEPYWPMSAGTGPGVFCSDGLSIWAPAQF